MRAFKKSIAIIICMVMVLCAMPVASFSAYNDISLDTYYNFCSDYADDYAYYEYVPSSSGYYRFYTLGYTDTFVEVVDSDYYLVGEDDDSGVGYNCNATVYLEKGQRYSFYVSYFDSYADFYSCITKVSSTKTTGIAQKNTYEVELDESNTSRFFKYIARKSGYYVFDSEGSYDSYGILYDSNWSPIAFSDDEGYSSDFYIQCYLEEGQTYYLEATQYDAFDYDTYYISVAATTVVTDIEIVEYPENNICYYDDYGDILVESLYLDGLKLKLTYSDGKEVYWEYWDGYIEGSNIDMTWDYDESGSLIFEIWTPFDYEFFNLDERPNPVKSISVRKEPELYYYQYTGGYYDTEYDYEYDSEFEYYSYYVPDLSDVELLVKYKDGTSQILSPYDYIDGKPFSCYTSQSGYTPWKVGGDNLVYIDFFGVETAVNVEIRENPVKSVVLNNPPTATYKIGDETYGFMYDDGTYLLIPCNFSGISITVNFTDGTSKTYDETDFIVFDDENSFTVDGYPFELYMIETNGEGTYTTTLDFCGVPIEYDVTVVDSIRGDADMDGAVSVMDATTIQLYKAGLGEISDAGLAVADVDDDGAVSVLDATKIQMFVASLIDEL